MLNCPNLCGKWCNWGESEKAYDDEELELMYVVKERRKKANQKRKKN